MSSLSKEQVQELTNRINERFAEFDVEGSRVFEWVTPGVARLVFDVVEEWQANTDYLGDDDPKREADAEHDRAINVAVIHDKAFTEGWKAGRESMRSELGVLERMGGWVGPHNIDPGIEMNTDRYVKPLAESHTDADQIRADLRAHTAYPSLEPEPNGADVFADVHPVAGAPEPFVSTEDELGAGAYVEPAPEISPLPELVPIAPPPTNGHDAYELSTASVVTLGASHTGGNGHHAEPSPAAVATLGPEHTVVTPLVPRRDKVLSEVDEAALSRTRMNKDELAADLRAVIYALQDMAIDGEMPSMNDWLLHRPEGMLTAQGIQKRHNLIWSELADYAKLKLKGTRGKGIGR